MTIDDQSPDVDLSVTPDAMVAIRDEVREGFVRQVHALRIQACAYRKAGFEYELRQCRRQIRRMVSMIHALDNPMEGLTFHPPTDPDDRTESMRDEDARGPTEP